MSVTFEPKRRVAWYGYRATKEWSPSSEKLELGIWQAGADSQYMMLGVSVVGTKRIWMNTLIVADPYKATSGQIGGGLYVKIDPVRAE